MKTKKLLFVACASLGAGLGVNAQVLQNATQPDVIIGSVAVGNTGLAIAPNIDVHAAALDDGAVYKIFWLDGPTGAVLDADGNIGTDPDVAYYADENFLEVAYEKGGTIIVDEYKLASMTPLDYVQSSVNPIFSGTYPNIDVNSSGSGILTWEKGGIVWLCAFSVGGFAAGPVVPINQGTQPDVVLLDDGLTVALTYIDPPSGKLVIETIDYAQITIGNYVSWTFFTASPMSLYEYPRIAAQRNQCCGPNSDFGVVVQDFDGFTSHVVGFFANGATITNPFVPINLDFLGCQTFDPRPVIVYDRDRIQIAWSQQYASCTSITQTNPNQEDDVIVASHKLNGNPLGVDYEEVNLNQSNFAGISKTSIATEYDGFGYIIDATFKFSVIYNDPGISMWKTRNALIPNFSDQAAPTEDRGDNFSLVSNPVEQTIEVLSESDEEATFQLLDNAGRIVELNSVSINGHQYSIDISHLSGGIYFLNCSSASGQEVLRILQITH